ncbi:MAG TPA: diacylglycerol kinase family protein [Capillimicrobium sp.]
MPAASPSLEQLEQLAAASQHASAVERRRMLVIVNPYATTVSDRLRNLVVYALQGRYDVTAIDTESAGHAVELCREAALEGYDVVVTFGGDGTVNEAANGLAGSPTPLCPLPGGNTNVFARILGIPNEIVDATEHVLRMADDWRPRMVDLPKVNDRLFTFSSGVGLDATVVRRVDARPHLKARFGPWFFTSAAVGSFVKDYVVRPPQLEVVADGGAAAITGVTAMVQNADPYTYFNGRPVHLAEGATLDSGTLSAVVLQRATPIDVPTIAFRALAPKARIVDHRRVGHFEGVREVVVRSADGRPVPLQVDGDHVGSVLEARYTVAPGALAVVS